GYIGMMGYVTYIFPGLVEDLKAAFPGLKQPGNVAAGILGTVLSTVVTLTLCRRIHVVGWLSVVLCAGTLLTVAVVIAAGLAHFDASLLQFPPSAFELSGSAAIGLGAA